MSQINFFCEEVEFTIQDKKTLRAWITRIIEQHQFILIGLNYIFCNDQYLYNLNQEYLDHDTFTDIITFDNSATEGEVEGDIFISIDRVRENALNQNTSQKDELYRVMIHGVLHLLGFNDKTTEEKLVMREKEDACLSLLRN